MNARPTAIGLRAHSGWAALVALAGPAHAPEVVDRRRIEMADDAAAKQPYHAAEGLPLARAAALLERWAGSARQRAEKGFAGMLSALEEKGCAPFEVVVLAAAGRPLPELPAVLASHALIHTADGEHFRKALAAASEAQGLRVRRVPERDLLARAEAVLRRPASVIQAALSAWGRPLGPPWTQDQKLSVLGAWLALAEAEAPAPGRARD